MTFDFEQFNETPLHHCLIDIDGCLLFSPRKTIRVKIRTEAEISLRNRFKPGLYKNPDKANEILKHLFTFYNEKLNQIIPLIYCKEWLVFLLFQYEQSGHINHQFKNQNLSEENYKYWQNNGPLFRQTSDYLVDKFIENSKDVDDNKLDRYNDLILFDEAWICAGNAIEYSSISNLTHMLIPDNTIVEILPEGNDIFLEHNILKDSGFEECSKKYLQRSNLEINIRDKYISGKSYEHDFEKHMKILDIPLKNYLGYSYSEILYLLTDISINTKSITSPSSIPMVNKKNFYKDLSINESFSINNVERLFAALILKKEDLVKHQREIWNYRQPFRVSKRPFVQIPHKGHDVLLWSDRKLKDYLSLLDLDVTFKNFPTEWSSPEVDKAIDEISNEAGKWFEKLVYTNFEKIGILGQRSVKSLAWGEYNLNISDEIGELDFLGFSKKDKAIVFVECKMLNSAFEPRSFRQERDRFIKGPNSFLAKFVKKVNWAQDNYEIILAIFSNKFNQNLNMTESKICCAFLTHYITIAKCFVDIIPCVTLYEFLEDYKSQAKWPYQNGIKFEKI